MAHAILKTIRSYGDLPVGTKGLRPDEVYVRSLQRGPVRLQGRYVVAFPTDHILYSPALRRIYERSIFTQRKEH